MDIDLDAIWERFRRTLHSLARSSVDQKQFGPGGCLFCELLLDFRMACEEFRRHFADMLTPEQDVRLDAISYAIDALELADMECFNEDVVGRPAWQRIRDRAITVVKALGCEGETTPDSVEIHIGIWRRPPS